jgi:hypothetical protein
MDRDSDGNQKRGFAPDEEPRRDEPPPRRAEDTGRCDGEALQRFEA